MSAFVMLLCRFYLDNSGQNGLDLAPIDILKASVFARNTHMPAEKEVGLQVGL